MVGRWHTRWIFGNGSRRHTRGRGRRPRWPRRSAAAPRGCAGSSSGTARPTASRRGPPRARTTRGRTTTTRGRGEDPRADRAAAGRDAGRGGRRDRQAGVPGDRLPHAGAAEPAAKKKSTHAAERDRADVVAKRATWFDAFADRRVADLVFLDEFGANTKMQRTHGRAAPGTRGSSPASRTATIEASARSRRCRPRGSSRRRPSTAGRRPPGSSTSCATRWCRRCGGGKVVVPRQPERPQRPAGRRPDRIGRVRRGAAAAVLAGL